MDAAAISLSLGSHFTARKSCLVDRMDSIIVVVTRKTRFQEHRRDAWLHIACRHDASKQQRTVEKARDSWRMVVDSLMVFLDRWMRSRPFAALRYALSNRRIALKKCTVPRNELHVKSQQFRQMGSVHNILNEHRTL
jgi:hypothetical protein